MNDTPTPTARRRCACGKTIGRDARECRACHAARMAACQAAVAAVVAGGRCPDCGAGVRRNLAIAGWWQCAQYGTAERRADATRPACAWQGFTE